MLQKRAFLSPGSIHRVASTDAEDLIQEAVSVCANESIDPTSIHDLDSEAKISGVTDSIVAEESSKEEKLNEDLKNLVTTLSFSCTEAFMRADHIDQPQISLSNLKPDHREKILEEFGEPVEENPQEESDSHMVNEADRKAGVMSQKVSFPALEQQSCLRSGITATCMEKAETEVVQEPYSPCMEETEEKSISKTSEMPHNWTVVLKPANVDASFEESDDRISFIL
ncbi:hypothetical protein Bca101_074468 [Brassica carinata]